ncbi:Putrescine-binding periplasmic protein-related [Hibiscus syriacus]|uniref:Putrescine-binding periplasmic protein-related n=1 Tax=Hibiscus syriacus TaxID=106335 RepID=A0A6A3CJA5_HIBSY|nr:Putrescine-binding periplasmic protein-related [Hibiscus syriacus]
MNFHLHHHSFATVDALVCRLIFEISKLYSALAMKIGEYVLQTIMMESYPEKLAVLRHLGHFSNEDITVDEAELQCHQKLQDLYISTKVAKHLQRNIVRGIEDFIATSTKLIEIARKLADDCCKYRAENENTGSPLARAALYFGKSHKSMEDEREALLGILGEKFNSFKNKLDFLHAWLAEAMAAVKPLALIRNENCGLRAEEKKNKSAMNLSFQLYSTSYLEIAGLQPAGSRNRGPCKDVF